jgi:hypothetical protein
MRFPISGRATALLAAAAAVAGLAALTSPREASAGPASRFLDPVVHDRAVRPDRGPFFSLRVHSMDAEAEAENLACFEYAAEDPLGGGARKYDLVRTAYKGRAAASDCDEILGVLLPPGATASYRVRAGTTRWIRREGPAGTPVGGFVGKMEVFADLTLASGETVSDVRLLELGLAGTTGLRPMRGNPDDATLLDEDRCRAPRHDEGWYLGRFDRRTLARYLGLEADDPERIAFVRSLARSLVGGTFEGRLEIDPDAASRLDYCYIAKAGWWFDGLAATDVRRSAVRRDPSETGTTR